MLPQGLSLALHGICVACLLWLGLTLMRHPEAVAFAAKAVLRRRAYTAIVLATVGISTLSLLVMGGYFQQSFWGLSESTIRSQTGHFQLMRRGWEAHSRTDPWKWALHDPAAVARLFASDSFLSARTETVAPELSFTGLLSNGHTSRTFLGRAVDPAADRRLSAFGEKISRGQRFLPDDRKAALLGAGLARSLEASPGAGLTVLTTTGRGGIASSDLDVKGVTESFSRDYDDVALKIPLSAAWEMLGDTLCDKVLVLLHETRDLDTVLARTRDLARAQGLDLEFRRWEELAPYYRSVRTLYTGIFRFFGTVLAAFAFVFVSCVLEMSFLQRRQEISLLRAFGASPPSLLRRFLTESVLTGFVGTLLATALSLAAIRLFNLHGLEAPPPPGSTRGYLVQLRVLEEPAMVLEVAEFVFAAVFLSSVLPCLRACRLPLIESLRRG